jgi:hypothetical protein
MIWKEEVVGVAYSLGTLLKGLRDTTPGQLVQYCDQRTSRTSENLGFDSRHRKRVSSFPAKRLGSTQSTIQQVLFPLE